MGSLFSSTNESINDLMFMPPKYDVLFTYEIKNDTNVQSRFVITESKFIKINFLLFKPPSLKKNVKWIVFSHDTKSLAYHHYKFAKLLCNKLQIGCIIYDYPGYGLSELVPTEENCYESLKAIVNYMTRELNILKSNIFLMGHALGTGVVCDYVYKHNWNIPIILISPHKSIIFNNVEKFKSFEKIKHIKCPIKIFHGRNDNIINISHGKELFSALKNKSFGPTWLEGVEHDNTLDNLPMNKIYEVLDYDPTINYIGHDSDFVHHID